MNGRISKLINRYCVALANSQTRDNDYRDRLQKVVKKAWNKTPSKERNIMRVRMERVITEHRKQLEIKNEQRRIKEEKGT